MRSAECELNEDDTDESFLENHLSEDLVIPKIPKHPQPPIQKEASIIIDDLSVFIKKEIINDLEKEGLLFTSKKPVEISGNINYIKGKAQRFADRNRKKGKHVDALYYLVITFTDFAEAELKIGNHESALRLSDISTRLLIFGQKCIRDLRKIKRVTYRGLTAAQKAIILSQKDIQDHVDLFIQDPINFAANIANGVIQAGSALEAGLDRLIWNTEDTKRTLEVLLKKWDSLTPDQKLEKSLNLIFYWSIPGVPALCSAAETPTKIAEMMENIKKFDVAFRKSKAFIAACKRAGKSVPSLQNFLTWGVFS